MNRSISKKKGWLFYGLLLFSFLPLTLPSLSQSPNTQIEKIASDFDSLYHNHPKELIYIQTSKGIYEPSEDLWFKAYILNSQTFTSSMLSKTLYVQMFNETTKKVVWQEKYEIQNGFTDGHIYLYDTLSVGDYLIAAYTGRSFYDDDQELKSVRRVCIRKEIRPNYDGWIEPVKMPAKTKEVIQFGTFPEGGNLIAGAENRLAFKAVKSGGSPVDVKGTLFEDTIPLLAFESIHAGMGSVMFTPMPGKKYHISLSEPAIDSVFLLPEVSNLGISLQLLKREKEYLEFVVRQGPSGEKKTVYIRGQVRGIVCCIARGELINDLKIKIPLKEFPFQGIAEFTLFDDNLTPLAERLVYVNPGKKLFIEADLNKERFETKEKATLKIKVKDENGQPVAANLGLSIYDNLYKDNSDPVNILTHCYLSSQLRGRIYDPGYYFDTLNTNRDEALDLLLLTQGWRRYIWNEEELKKQAQSRIIITDYTNGEIHATANKRKAKSIQLILKAFYPNKDEKSEFLFTDSSGRFIIDYEQLKAGKSSYVYLESISTKEFLPRISLSDPFLIINSTLKKKDIKYPFPGPIQIKKEEIKTDYVEGYKSIKLKEVVVSARGTHIYREKYIGRLDSIAKYNSTSDYVCLLDHFLNCPFHTDDKTHKPVEGEIYYIPYGVDLENRHFHGSTDIVYQYPKYTEEELLKMNNISRVKAYYIHREFYEPKYDLLTNADSVSDLRNTLLWKPLLLTDAKGEATVDFYCSDLNTSFTGVIEGVSKDGLLGAVGIKFYVIKAKKAK